jgi:hypothetical protein
MQCHPGDYVTINLVISITHRRAPHTPRGWSLTLAQLRLIQASFDSAFQTFGTTRRGSFSRHVHRYRRQERTHPCHPMVTSIAAPIMHQRGGSGLGVGLQPLGCCSFLLCSNSTTLGQVVHLADDTWSYTSCACSFTLLPSGCGQMDQLEVAITGLRHPPLLGLNQFMCIVISFGPPPQ